MPAKGKRESATAGNARLVFEDIWKYGKLGRQRRLEFWRQNSPHVYDNLLLHYPLVSITDLHPPAVVALPDIDNLNDWSIINRSRGTTQTTLVDFLSELTARCRELNARCGNVECYTNPRCGELTARGGNVECYTNGHKPQSRKNETAVAE